MVCIRSNLFGVGFILCMVSVHHIGYSVTFCCSPSELGISIFSHTRMVLYLSIGNGLYSTQITPDTNVYNNLYTVNFTTFA